MSPQKLLHACAGSDSSHEEPALIPVSFRLAWRLFRRNWSRTAGAAITLGIGMGLTVGVFSILYGTLLRGLPFSHQRELVAIQRADPSTPPALWQMPAEDFLYLRDHQTSFRGLAGFSASYAYITAEPEGTAGYVGASVTANLFQLLGVQPILGRGFVAEDDQPGAPAAGLLGFMAWHELFAADPGILGRTVVVNRERVTIVGVMPEGFGFPFRQQLWVPLRLGLPAAGNDPGATIFVIGRLEEGVRPQQAQAELTHLAAQLRTKAASASPDVHYRVRSYTELNTDESFQRALYGVLAAAGLLYLLCCSNLLHLMLATARQRSQDLAIRTALGASRGALLRLLLLEWLPFAGLAAALAAGVAQLAILIFRALARTSAQLRAFWIDVHLDLPALLILLGLTLGACVLAALIPVLVPGMGSTSVLLREPGSGISNRRLVRASRTLAVVKAAVATALLLPMLLVSRSLAGLWLQGRELENPKILTIRLSLHNAGFTSSRELVAFYQGLLAAVEQVPGAETAAVSSFLPAEGHVLSSFEVERPSAGLPSLTEAWEAGVTPGFFRMFPLHLEQGRGFLAHERGQVAIVSRAFAMRYLGGVGSALGRRIRSRGDQEETEEWLTIVGVVSDLPLGSFEENDSLAAVYLPWYASAAETSFLLVKAREDAASLAPKVRETVAATHRLAAWSDLRTMDDVVARSAWDFRFFGAACMIFGFAALAVAGMGVYSVVSFLVEARRAELGLRSALGARPVDLGRLVLTEGLLLIAVGLMAGMAVVAPFAKHTKTIFFEIDPWKPSTLVLAAAVLATLGIVACLGPVRRAAGTDPAVTMRQGVGSSRYSK